MSSAIEPLRSAEPVEHMINPQPMALGRTRRSSLSVKKPVDRPALIRRSSLPLTLITSGAVALVINTAEREFALQQLTTPPISDRSDGGGCASTDAAHDEEGEEGTSPRPLPVRSSSIPCDQRPFTGSEGDILLVQATSYSAVNCASSTEEPFNDLNGEAGDATVPGDHEARSVPLEEDSLQKTGPIVPASYSSILPPSTSIAHDETSTSLLMMATVDDVPDFHPTHADTNVDHQVDAYAPSPPAPTPSKDLRNMTTPIIDSATDIPTLNLQLLCEEAHGQDREEEQLVPVPHSFVGENLISPLILPSPAELVFGDMDVRNTPAGSAIITGAEAPTGAKDQDAGARMLPEIVVTSPVISCTSNDPAVIGSPALTDASVEVQGVTIDPNPLEPIDRVQTDESEILSFGSREQVELPNGQSVIDDAHPTSSMSEQFTTTITESYADGESALQESTAEDKIVAQSPAKGCIEGFRPIKSRSRATSLDLGSRSPGERPTVKHRAKSISGSRVPATDIPFAASLISILCLERLPSRVQLL